MLRWLPSVTPSKALLPVMSGADESRAQLKLQLEGSILQRSSEVPQGPEERETERGIFEVSPSSVWELGVSLCVCFFFCFFF